MSSHDDFINQLTSDDLSGDFADNLNLAQSLFENDAMDSKIVAMKNKAPTPSETFQNNMKVVYSQNRAAPSNMPKRTFRHVSPTPERILDAPDILDDYYTNTLDWSSRNTLGVALGPSVYLWDSATGGINTLCDVSTETSPDNFVSALSWNLDGIHAAVATNDNDIQIWNVERQRCVRVMTGHAARVNCFSWNNHVLSSGSRDTNIFHHDVRAKEHHFATLSGHDLEVCNIKWSPDGTQLASGSNDNTCRIWDASSSGNARFTFSDSAAAVKALAWCPWQKNVLATGSGSADRHIRFYNSQTGALINSIDTQSQVCSLQWSITEKELLSSHGYSQNNLTVWKFPSLVKVADLHGHQQRVLHTAVSPDGTTVCSAGVDETLRFWRVWESAEEKAAKRKQEEAYNTGSFKSDLNMKVR
jgi:cell division cycle protein 20 (cofactor of APC complex)